MAQERAGLGAGLVTRLGLLLELVDDDPANDRPDDGRAKVRPASVRTGVALRLHAARRLRSAAAVAVTAPVNSAAIDATPLRVIALAGPNLNEIVEHGGLHSHAGSGGLHD